MSSKDVEVTFKSDPQPSEASNVAADPSPAKQTRWRYLWDTFDKSPEERRFILKLDLGLLLAACLGRYTVYGLFYYKLTAANPNLTSIIGFFIKYLDQSNLSNAFVSGMYVFYFIFIIQLSVRYHVLHHGWILTRRVATSRKEDLDMYENQLNYAQTLWTVGYIIGEVPSNILITRVRPSIWIPAGQVRTLTMEPSEFCRSALG
jgi:MFS transporter, ACS family, pantothenate transporter